LLASATVADAVTGSDGSLIRPRIVVVNRPAPPELRLALDYDGTRFVEHAALAISRSRLRVIFGSYAKQGATCGFTAATSGEGAIEAAVGGVSCPGSRCSALCASVAPFSRNGSLHQQGFIVSGTAPAAATELRVSSASGRTVRVALRGPVLAKPSKRRVVLAELDDPSQPTRIEAWLGKLRIATIRLPQNGVAWLIH
jgi:hypothetical protein